MSSEPNVHILVASMISRPSGDARGGEIYAEKVRSYLANKGYSVHSVNDQVVAEGCNAVELLRHFPVLHVFIVSLLLLHKIRSHDWPTHSGPALLVVNTHGRGIHLLGYLLKSRRRCFCWIATEHNSEEFWLRHWTRAFGGKHRWANACFQLPQVAVLYFIELLSIFRSDHIVCTSPQLVARYRQLGVDPCRISLMSQGVDPEKRHSASTPSSPYVFIGREPFVKGADIATAADGIYRKAGGKRGMVIVGLQPAGQSNPWMEFIGEIDPASRKQLLGSAHALLVPSRYDTGPIVALEALASGVPVIISNRCGLAGYIQARGYGIVVEPQPSELAGAMMSLDGPNELHSALRSNILASFDLYWSNVLSDYETVLKSVIGKLNGDRRSKDA